MSQQQVSPRAVLTVLAIAALLAYASTQLVVSRKLTYRDPVIRVEYTHTLFQEVLGLVSVHSLRGQLEAHVGPQTISDVSGFGCFYVPVDEQHILVASRLSDHRGYIVHVINLVTNTQVTSPCQENDLVHYLGASPDPTFGHVTASFLSPRRIVAELHHPEPQRAARWLIDMDAQTTRRLE